MPPPPTGFALNRTRQVFLATRLRCTAGWVDRLRGLLATPATAFSAGSGLWIAPSQGVHCLGMGYAIDAVYLDRRHYVIHIEAGLRPWRLGAIRHRAVGVLELPAGTVARTRTALGDHIRLRRQWDEDASEWDSWEQPLFVQRI